MSVVAANEGEPFSWGRLAALLALGAGAAATGFALPAGPATEAWFLAFVTAAGLAFGSLVLLMLGHIMGEEWLNPLRSELEAAARTVPLLVLFAIPLATRLPELYPWAADEALRDLTPVQRALFQPGWFTVRSGFYLAVWCGLAFWVTETRRPRRASAIGLAALVLTIDFAATDWVMSREPAWLSGLFPFAFGISQLLAVLAGAILVSLLGRERPSAARMQSLERALLTLALLALWTWFAQFLIVWLANLPAEAAWYLRRAGPWLWLLAGIAVPALLAAALLLVPPGVGRKTILTASVLVLVQHVAYSAWLLRPAARDPAFTLYDLAVPGGLGLLWLAWFATAHRRRPSFASEHEGYGQGGTTSAGKAV